MRIVYTFAFLFLGFIALGAQVSTTADSRILAVYPQSDIDFWTLKNPFHIQRLNYFLDHSWSLVDLPAEKVAAGTGLRQINVPDINNINILKLQNDLGLKRDANSGVYYQIEGTNKAIYFLSEKDFVQKLNVATGRIRS